MVEKECSSEPRATEEAKKAQKLLLEILLLDLAGRTFDKEKYP